MPLKCVAIDDEPLALELIKTYVARFAELEMLQVFDDAISGAEFIRKIPVDILFVDINMPDITGLDLVRSLEEKPIIIFTTAHRKFALEGFELDAIDYLLKPISFERFSKAVKKAIEYSRYKNQQTSESAESLFVYSEYRLIKIPFADIEYIESVEDYIKIHLSNAKPILTLMPLKKVLEKLPPEKFKRIHRSYIVAIEKVNSILNRKVQLSSSTELPISDSYSSFIKEWKK
ncbi:LytR/AlgR family response regulator transcription factor [Terrimonas pollutisoli]|uniref:LytR/AlgR family response regulator transcription factor n=1 Tax=Terrimonas pollutisoli TaxID=3034147 RepID=UPI0023EDB8F5|nr:LytTR family DNA-binding domain-containing protein [Terrimonas sp. H1YJ31]